jgi:hypothetical protein
MGEIDRRSTVCNEYEVVGSGRWRSDNHSNRAISFRKRVNEHNGNVRRASR